MVGLNGVGRYGAPRARVRSCGNWPEHLSTDPAVRTKRVAGARHHAVLRGLGSPNAKTRSWVGTGFASAKAEDGYGSFLRFRSGVFRSGVSGPGSSVTPRALFIALCAVPLRKKIAFTFRVEGRTHATHGNACGFDCGSLRPARALFSQGGASGVDGMMRASSSRKTGFGY